MKKLLLTLGAVASVAAPVAAVVACSNDNVTKITKAEADLNNSKLVKEILQTTGYEMTDVLQKKLSDYLTKEGGNYKLSIDHKEAGKKPSDPLHGSDDFLITLNGGVTETLSGADYTTSLSMDKTKDDLSYKNHPIANEFKSSAASYKDNWGLKDSHVDDAQFIVYVQVDASTKAGILQIGKIYKYNGKIFVAEIAAKSLPTQDRWADVFPNDLNGESHGLVDFPITTPKTTA